MTTAGNRIEIQVGAKTKEAEDGFKRVETKAKGLSETLAGAGVAMGMVTRAMGIIGVASLGSIFGLSKLANATAAVATRSASTSLILDQFGSGLQKQLAALQPQFRGIGKEFGFTESQLVGAFGAIVRASQGTEVDINKLRFAMGLAQSTALDLSGASDVVGRAMLGQVAPLEAVIGRVNSFEEAQASAIARGLEATTAFDRAGATWGGLFEGMAAGLGDLLNDLDVMYDEFFTEKLPGWWDATIGWMGKTWNITVDAIGTFFTGTIPTWWKSTVGWLNKTWNITINAIGDFFTARIPGWWSSVVGWLGKKVDITINAVGDFFDKREPGWWTDVKDFIGLGDLTLDQKMQIALDLKMGKPPTGILGLFFNEKWEQKKPGAISLILEIKGRIVGVLSKFLGKIWLSMELGTEMPIDARLDLGAEFVGPRGGWLTRLWGWIRDKSGPSLTLSFLPGPVRGLVGVFFTDWGAVKTDPVVRVLVDFVAQAGKDIWEFLKKGLDPRQITFDMGGLAPGWIGPNASGGNVGGGGMALVGERGPELVNLPSGSSIRPSLAGMGSLGGGITINVYGNIDNEITIQSMVRQMKEALEDAERVGPSFG